MRVEHESGGGGNKQIEDGEAAEERKLGGGWIMSSSPSATRSFGWPWDDGRVGSGQFSRGLNFVCGWGKNVVPPHAAKWSGEA